ncbi:MAG: YggT family protein [Clostridia bacterium]|nr:YggT family protein [Clostridia bacterium]
MEEFVYVFTSLVNCFLQALQFCMLIRAVLSWFPLDDSNKFLIFIESVTEPVIFPIRAIFDRIPFLANFPIDLSFLVAYILLSVVSGLLGGGIA